MRARALLLSASALAPPGAVLCGIYEDSPLLAETSAAEKGVQILRATRVLKIVSAKEAMRGLRGPGKNSAKAKVSDASPRRVGDWLESRSGKADL